MADPTAYDEVQDGRLDALEGLVQTNYVPPTGSEYSFPAERMPISQSQFSLLSLPAGDGILGRGGWAYRLTGLENVNNTGKLGVDSLTGRAEAIVAGFFHVLTQDMTISLPAVTSTTVYHVCLTYDPRKLGDQGTEDTDPQGPVSVQVYAGTPPTDQGRKHVVLHKVTRAPNQLLTDATVERIGPRIVSTGYAYAESQLPDPTGVLWGSLMTTGDTGDIYRAIGDTGGYPNRWENITSPGWVEPGYFSSTYKYPGSGFPLGRQKTGKTIRLRGRVALASGNQMTVNASGYKVMTLPSDWRATSGQRFVVSGDGGQLASVLVSSATDPTEPGGVRIFPITGAGAWFSLDGIQFDIN